MSLKISLSEGPNVVGLSEDRDALYVGYSYQGNNLIFRVIEGRKVGTPRSYKLHLGVLTADLEDDAIAPLEEAEITRVEYTSTETTVDFKFRGQTGRFSISNESPKGRFTHGNIDEIIETAYSFFGQEKATSSLRPANWSEYYP